MKRFGLLSLLALLDVPALPAQEKPAAADPEGVEFFEKKIRPVLIDSCYTCHSASAKSVKGGLKLDTRDSLRNGGDTGPAIVPGDPDKSLLIQAIRRGNLDTAMPPKKTLPKEVVADFEAWVKRGAPDPRTGGSLDPVAGKAKTHWAFQPVKDPSLPKPSTAGWAKNAVDAFLLAKLEEKRMKPQPEADRRTLIRRASFDLLGLPPAPEEVEAFEKDKDPQAYEKLIDRLLASPAYGERWGRHWLDVARYSDTKGYVFQEERRYPFAYTYRDWVVRALNNDLPYDQFIVQQIAADRLPLGEDKRPLAAMGFLTVGRRFLNNIADITDDRLDVVGRGLMGLSIGCARCHDHKFDPIPAKDYYSLYGVFVSSTEPKELPVIETGQKTPQALEYEKELQKLQAEVDAFKKQRHAEKLKGLRTAKSIADYLMASKESKGIADDKLRDFAQKRDLAGELIVRWRELLKKPDAVFKAWTSYAALADGEFVAKAKEVALDGVHPKVLVAFQTPPATLREAADRLGTLLASTADAELQKALAGAVDVPFADLEKLYNRKDRDEQRAKEKKIEAHKASHPGAPQHAMVLNDLPKPVNPRVFIRGNPANPGAEVPRRFLSVLAGENAPPFQDGSGRLELARAIASPGNPLTARVMVNRVWTLHFGQGLVRTPSDFGLRTEPPTHPELLDWLSTRFVEGGWSLKKLHKLLMTSAGYRQRSEGPADYATADPDNRLLWRMNRKRLEFEALRDSLLAVAGRLDPAMGGKAEPMVTNPTVRQKMNAETITNEGGGDAAQDVFARRRAIYLFIDRQNLPQTLRAFDFASPDQHTPQRFVTTVPQQALFLMNNPFVLEQAKHLAARARDVQSMHRLLFGRAPTAEEAAAAKRFVDGFERGGASTPDAVAWRYGYGKVDEAGKVSFTPLPHFTGTSWQGGAAMPDAKLGWVNLTADGGHPAAQVAAIRRWTSPRDAVVSIEGALVHKAAEGDGVLARIVSSRDGALASWTAHHTEAETKMSRVELRKGDTLDFLVECRKDEGWDSFQWAPVIRTVETPAATGGAAPQEWRAAEQFGGAAAPGKAAAGPTAWERYAHVLLQTNEFIFVD